MPRRSRPAGFTLLEAVLALGMTVLLVTAIYGAILLYVRISQDDEQKLERSRLTRALFRQISLDIQSVVFRTEEETQAAAGEDSESSGSTVNSLAPATTQTDYSGTTETSGASQQIESVPATTPDDALASTSLGLIGDAQKLTLHISRPARETNYQPVLAAGGVGVRTSDLQSITYFLADASGSGLEGAVGQRALSGSRLAMTSQSGPQGLARLAGDRMAIEHADIESDIDALAEAATIIAPEVVSLAFRYFDGLNWVDEWDSLSSQRLPNAVEITIGLQRIVPEDEQLATQFNSEARAEQGAVVETRRHVVAVPLSTPYTEGL